MPLSFAAALPEGPPGTPIAAAAATLGALTVPGAPQLTVAAGDLAAAPTELLEAAVRALADLRTGGVAGVLRARLGALAAEEVVAVAAARPVRHGDDAVRDPHGQRESNGLMLC
jgi:hypothetical protein